MMNKLDALSVREVNGKSYWTRIGVAFPSKDGSGWNVLLDAMPAPVEGQFKITLRPPQDDRQSTRKPAAAVPPSPPDDIPFAPEWRG